MSTNASDPPQFPDDCAAALGHMLVAFQSLEAGMLYSLARFLNPESAPFPKPLAVAVLGELSFGALTKLLAHLPNAIRADDIPELTSRGGIGAYGEAVAELQLAIRLITTAEERRNQLVHSQWIWGHGPAPGESVFRLKFRAGRKAHSKSTMVEESEETIQAAIQSADEAHRRLAIATNSLYRLIRTQVPHAT